MSQRCGLGDVEPDAFAPIPRRGSVYSADSVARLGLAVGAEQDDDAGLVERAEDEYLGADRADLARREVNDGDDGCAEQLLPRVVGDLRGGALLPDSGPK